MKTNIQPLTIWIVGASSGIGLELTKLWLDSGHKVIASSRQANESESLFELKHTFPYHLILLDVDAANATMAEHYVDQAWNAFGGIDRWFYNAGAYEVMRFEAWDIKSFEQMNATNYMGAVHLMIPLSQRFATHGGGEWVWNASLSSYFGLPYGGAYSAPKAALLNLAESLQPELKTKGITLRIINHGFVKTRLTSKNSFDMPQLMEPQYAAEEIAKALDSNPGFEIRFPKALSRFLSLLRLLPYSLSLKLTSKTLR